MIKLRNFELIVKSTRAFAVTFFALFLVTVFMAEYFKVANNSTGSIITVAIWFVATFSLIAFRHRIKNK